MQSSTEQQGKKTNGLVSVATQAGCEQIFMAIKAWKNRQSERQREREFVEGHLKSPARHFVDNITTNSI